MVLIFIVEFWSTLGLPWWFSGNKLPASAGDVGLSPGSGRSPGKGNGDPLQYGCLRNPLARGAWWVIQSMGLQKSQIQLSD